MHQEIKLISKRNEVKRIINDDKTYIIKKFRCLDEFDKEKNILNILKENNANVPEILYAEKNTLFLQDLGEFTLLKWYEQIENKNSECYEEIILKLCFYFSNIYEIFKNNFKEQLILYDVNFRNFIIKNNEVYGIDFELVQKGELENDAGKLAAYALTYDPSNTHWKIKFCNVLINMFSDKLNIDKKLILEEQNKELNNIYRRRNINVQNRN